MFGAKKVTHVFALFGGQKTEASWRVIAELKVAVVQICVDIALFQQPRTTRLDAVALLEFLRYKCSGATWTRSDYCPAELVQAFQCLISISMRLVSRSALQHQRGKQTADTCLYLSLMPNIYHVKLEG